MTSSNTNQNSYRLAIIIPFYNEEKRIMVQHFSNFALQQKDILLVMVDDGSTDNTTSLLHSIHDLSPGNTKIILLPKNSGKGNAIRAGMLSIVGSAIPYIAYMDADLSAPFEEILRLSSFLPGSDYTAILGSRMMKSDSQIKRSLFRHISGRTVANVIDSHFKIGFYDTQCSAKIFRYESLVQVIQEPFYTRWFFDVELILRIRKQTGKFHALETPVKVWEHKAGSKINAFSVFSIIKEIYILFRKY